ncbi:DMT family transporter [Pseudomonas sp. MSSRFD41]|uniref:DMT family transporter n=1 Tax=Pseudomonas sp. MSSRFD41 TaxID=1310370 RepID=UPI00163A2451|nr:DMT family transporter [Pseudomonas sp. MSSRFD41]MBC2659138.1 DMT family transporter [Pseudomonas sp. MSSRFD41]
MNVSSVENRQSIIIVVGSVFLLSVSDAIIKAASAQISLWQLNVIRSLLAVVMLAALVLLRNGKDSLWPQSPGWATLRGLLLALMWIAFYAALPFITLTMAALAIYTTPLFITLFSSIYLKERITPRKWFSIVLGFAGVLVTLNPTADDFSSYALLPILAAILYALAAVVTKGKCADEDAMVLAMLMNLVLLASGLLGSLLIAMAGPLEPQQGQLRFLLGDWSYMQLADWTLMVLLAVLMVLVSTGIARAYQIGEPSIIGAFDYTYLVFAILWGVLVFEESLNARIVTGLVMILMSGFVLFKRPA